MRLTDFIDNFDNSMRVQILNGNNLLFDGSVYDFNTLLNSEVVEGGASCEKEYVRIHISGLREGESEKINSVEEIGVLNIDLAYAKWLTTILKTYMKLNINNLATELIFDGKQYTIEDAVDEIVSITDEYISLRHDTPDMKTERDLLSNLKYAGRLFTEVMPYLWL